MNRQKGSVDGCPMTNVGQVKIFRHPRKLSAGSIRKNLKMDAR
jgi:hypothetical protein